MNRATVKSSHIVIVNYNAGAWLQRSVVSALATGADRVSVVDNASSDQSVVDLQSRVNDPRLTLLQNKSNVGFAAANNQVLNELQEDFAVLLNPDCEINRVSLEAILSAFGSNSKLGLAGCRIVDESGITQRTSKRRFPTPLSALMRMLYLHKIKPHDPRFQDFDYASEDDVGFEIVEAVSGALMVVRREALQQVGGLDEEYFMHCEDLDWCKRFALAGWQVGYIGDATVTHAKGVSSQTRPLGVLWNLHAGMARFFDKYYRAQIGLPLYWLVRLGIAASFCLRALGIIIKRAIT